MFNHYHMKQKGITLCFAEKNHTRFVALVHKNQKATKLDYILAFNQNVKD